MEKVIAGMIFLCLYAPTFSQKAPSSAEMEAILKNVQRQADSILNSPKMKKMIRDGRAVNTDSIIRSARNKTGGGMPGNMGSMAYGGGTGMRPETANVQLPPKDVRTLGAPPSKK